MQKVKKWLNKIDKKQKIILLIVLLVVASCITTFSVQIVKQIRKSMLAEHGLLEWKIQDKTQDRDDYTAKILIKVTSLEGIEQIEFPDGYILYCKNKKQVGIDYDIVRDTEYNFKIKEVGKEEVTEKVYWEIQRIQGDYTLKNGIYAYKPKLDGYESEYTRYLSYESNKDSISEGETIEEKLVPSNWINGEEPANWYDYKKGIWANIYVETGGPETYYTWIPRYCFKLDQENQRSDVKFIDVYNNYKDENGNITPWKSEDGVIGLEEQGYQIPEAFWFNETELPGYWMMKYTIRRLFIKFNNKLRYGSN